MATQTHLKQFDKLSTSISKLDLSKLYREDLGAASFVSIRPTIESFVLKLSRTDKVKSLLSDNLLQSLNSVLSKLYSHLSQVVAYTDAQFVSNKAQIQNVVISLNEQLLAIWPQIVSIINDTDKRIEIDQTLADIERLKAKTLEDAMKVEQIKDLLSSDLKSFEDRYKNELFNKAELIKQEDNFSRDSKGFRAASYWWLVGVGVTSGLLLFMLVFLFRNFCFEVACFDNTSRLDYNKICDDCNRSVLYLEIFKSVAYRILIISFILYLINICFKNYNASMHNYTVNKHKANSLAAALILLEKAKTSEGNDQIMTQAASSIFSHQPTGYNSKDPENITTSLTGKIIEKVNPV